MPNTGRKKALIIVDVQPAFINPENRYIIGNIARLIRQVPYDLYVDAIFWTDEDSIWKKQLGWECPKDEDCHLVNELECALEGKKRLHVEKQTKSVFKGDIDLASALKNHGIEEVHIVGTETDDCVLTSANASFDNKFFTYVIEECCQSKTNALHEHALAILRRVKLTNHCLGADS